jgi:hypothetical protein
LHGIIAFQTGYRHKLFFPICSTFNVTGKICAFLCNGNPTIHLIILCQSQKVIAPIAIRPVTGLVAFFPPPRSIVIRRTQKNAFGVARDHLEIAVPFPRPECTSAGTAERYAPGAAPKPWAKAVFFHPRVFMKDKLQNRTRQAKCRQTPARDNPPTGGMGTTDNDGKQP